MHIHFCRYCRRDFVCAVEITECSTRLITCDECFAKHETAWCWLVTALLVIALLLTVLAGGK
jgi:hypothetical protein